MNLIVDRWVKLIATDVERRKTVHKPAVDGGGIKLIATYIKEGHAVRLDAICCSSINLIAANLVGRKPIAVN